jgi:glutamyl-tRNA reductase
VSVLAVGLSHTSAPTSVIERASLSGEDARKALHELVGSDGITEAVVLSTCTRVEVYVDTATFHGGVDAVSDLLVRTSGLPLAQLQEHLYLHHDARAVQHLFEVTCGLDSVLVGEAQIQGQVREAMREAEAEGTLGRVLGELFRHAIRTGRRARTETGIDAAARSLVSEGVRAAATTLGGLAGRRALVVGAGATGSLATAVLLREGVAGVVVANRTPERAAHVAALCPPGIARTVGLGTLADEIALADVVVCSTAGSEPVVTVEHVGRRSIVLVDLAMPRDVAAEVAELPGVHVIDIDSLRRTLADEPMGRDVAAVVELVDTEVRGFSAWQHARAVAPTVTALREQAARVVAEELARLWGRLPELDDTARAEVSQGLGRVVDKLLHAPTVRVKELAAGPHGEVYAEALRELFGLDRDAVHSVSSPAAREAGAVTVGQSITGGHP